jgi:hypothetical protein
VGQPTLAGFLAFVRNVMGITSEQLPDDSVYLGYAFDVALALVSLDLGNPGVDGTGSIYSLAVYNLAGDRLLNYAQDVPDAPSVPGSGDPGLPFFAYARQSYGVNSFVAGVIEASSDETDSVSIAVPESLREVSLSDLSNLKTPYGRQYLAFAQQLGTLWGLS